MDGKALAARIRADVAAQVAEVGRIGLHTVLVGDDPASDVYIRLKHQAAREAGIDSVDHRLSVETSQVELERLVDELSADDGVDAILVQSPLPPHLDEDAVVRRVEPEKDVDGLHPHNAGELYLGRPALVGATPLGVMALLREYDVPLAGAEAVVLGRSAIVGKPAATLLLRENATVTVCHSRTRELAEHTRRADVLVAAVGVPHLVTPEMVKAGAAVIDVGMTRTDAGLVGDVDPAVAERAGFLTPVPGGVGPMTIAMLLANTIHAARQRRGLLALAEG